MQLNNPVLPLVAASTRRPLAVLGLAIALTLAALAYAASHFAMTTDASALISPKVEWRQQEQVFARAFPQLQDLSLIVVDGATPELAEMGAAKLSEKLAADKAHFRSVRRPDGGPFFAQNGLLFGNVAEAKAATSALIEAQPLLGPLAADPSLRGVMNALGTVLTGVQQGQAPIGRIEAPMARLADATEGALAGKPVHFSWQRLFGNGNGALAAPTRRLILVQPVLDYGALQPGAVSTDAIFGAARSLGLDGVKVRVTGQVPLDDEEFASLQDNIGLVGGIMAAAMLLMLWLAMRSLKIVLAILLTIVAGLAVTSAVGLAAVGRLNLISIAFIPLFVGLGVDFGIQISVRFNAERLAGADTPEALRRAARALGAPLALAAGAVFLGFGAFLPTAYVGIAELGVISGLGMIVALLLSVTLLPALLMLLKPGKPRAEVGFREAAPLDRFLERHRKGVLVAFAVSMAVSIALLPLVRFDFNPLHLRDPNGPAMLTLSELMRDPTRTPNTLDALAPGADQADALARRLDRVPEVAQTVTLDSFVPPDQQAKLAVIQDASLLLDPTLNPFDIAPAPSDTETVTALANTAAQLRAAAPNSPTARRLAADLERLVRAGPAARKRLANALIPPLNVMLDAARASLQAQPIARDTLPQELRRDWQAPDGRTRVQIFPSGDSNDNRVLSRFTEAVRTIAPDATGLPVSTQEAAGTIGHAFVQAGLIALALVSLLLVLILRSVRETAFTLAPVVLSGFLTLGTCVLIGQPINFANIIAFPLLFGVGVAFHIYFVMAWRAGATDLLQSSLARAVLFSALATGTAFGALWFSHHLGTASMGKILMLSLAWTLVCALIFEPALLGPPPGGGSREGEGAGLGKVAGSGSSAGL